MMCDFLVGIIGTTKTKFMQWYDNKIVFQIILQ